MLSAVQREDSCLLTAIKGENDKEVMMDWTVEVAGILCEDRAPPPGDNGRGRQISGSIRNSSSMSSEGNEIEGEGRETPLDEAARDEPNKSTRHPNAIEASLILSTALCQKRELFAMTA